MKTKVTVPEIQAATMLLLGVPADALIELHINSTAVSGIAVGAEGELVALRAVIVTGNEEEPESEDAVEAEIVEDEG